MAANHFRATEGRPRNRMDKPEPALLILRDSDFTRFNVQIEGEQRTSEWERNAATRERVPLDWAFCFGDEGLALMLLAERRGGRRDGRDRAQADQCCVRNAARWQ